MKFIDLDHAGNDKLTRPVYDAKVTWFCSLIN